MAKKQTEKHSTMTAHESVIDEHNLNAEFLQLPASVAYWNAQYADAYRAWLAAKRRADTVFAEVYLETRDEAERDRAKTTEATIKATVEIDDRFVAAQDALVVAETEKVRLLGVLESLRVRRDALMSVGANMRAEHQSTGLRSRDD